MMGVLESVHLTFRCERCALGAFLSGPPEHVYPLYASLQFDHRHED